MAARALSAPLLDHRLHLSQHGSQISRKGKLNFPKVFETAAATSIYQPQQGNFRVKVFLKKKALLRDHQRCTLAA